HCRRKPAYPYSVERGEATDRRARTAMRSRPMRNTATAGTVDRADVDRFERIAADWWSASGPFRPLHRMNPVRIGFIRDRVADHFGADPSAAQPLDGLRLADIGC